MKNQAASCPPTSPSAKPPRKKRLRLAVAAAAAAMALVLPIFTAGPQSDAPAVAADISVLDGQLPTTLVDPDTVSVELGATFSSSQDGTVTAIRFFKSAANAGPHVVNLWSSSGQKLSTATLPAEAAEGWQSVKLPAPVEIAKEQQFVASYIAPQGKYSSQENGLAEGKTKGPLTLHANGGVYAYGTGGTLPQSTYRNNNYFVDVVFTPAPADVPTTSPPGNATPSPAPPGGALPAGVTVRQVDGGTEYYAQFNNPLPSTPEYFPVAVWYESLIEPGDTELDKAVGLNTYLELTPNSDATLATQAGMHAITTWNAPGQSGSLLPDEVDMWAGPGSAPWTGNWPGQGEICVPADAQCGYTIQAAQKAAAAPGAMLYANYGKGVTFWETDAQAAQFVNDYPDVLSADNYWFTDPNICGISEGGVLVAPQRVLSENECRKAANYGWTMERVRSLVRPVGAKPVWAFIEVGHPFTQDSAPTITGPQMKAAVWSSIIHGARGVVYFNHNFGGACETQHVLRDGCGAQIRPAVTEVNTQIEALAPVLNAPFLDGAATSTGAVDVSVKTHGERLYVFAASTANGNQQVELSITCSNANSAAVLGENRTVPVRSGVIEDTFADGNAVHLYELNGTNGCGLS